MSLPPVTAARSPTPAASSDPVSLRRIRADAVRRNAMVLDDALADALDLLPRAKPAISAHLPRDSRGRLKTVSLRFNSTVLQRSPREIPSERLLRGRADRAFVPPGLAKIFGDDAGVISRHWPAGRDRFYQHAIRSEKFVPIVAVGVVEQFAQCPHREGLRLVHARNVLRPG
jgi:hypothetical protein